MKTLYFDMTSGLSGDMTVAGLMDSAGVSDSSVSELFSEFFKQKFDLKTKETFVNGIVCKRLQIDYDKNPEVNRNFLAIKDMILSSGVISERVKEDSIGIFRIIAEAEGSVHGKNVEEVHFHEVGAVDSIIDIVGVSYLMEKIDPVKVIFSLPRAGSGIVNTAHGQIPVPAPATLKILEDLEVERLYIGDELTTPTGAAVIKYYHDSIENHFKGKILKSSYSTGTKSFRGLPNMLRIIQLESVNNNQAHDIMEIQTNIDDMSGEEMGYLLDRVLEADCLDAFFQPIYGKKNRPAYKLTVLCRPEDFEYFSGLILEESSTAGLRYSTLKRRVLDRHFEDIEYKGISIRIKVLHGNGILKKYPEFADVREAARSFGEPFGVVYRNILSILNV